MDEPIVEDISMQFLGYHTATDRLSGVIARALERSRKTRSRVHVIEELGEVGVVSDAFVRRRPRVKIVASFERGIQVTD